MALFKRLTLLLTFIFLLLLRGYGQGCPNAPLVILKTQNHVDSFIIKYPNCKNINNLLITDSITDLSGLKNIITAREIEISETQNLKDLTGLSGLRVIFEDLDINNNQNLLSLNGLSNLDTVYGNLFINRNEKLSSIESISKINYINNLYIDFLKSLKSLKGLQYFKTIKGDLRLQGNDSLVSLKFLDSLESVGKSLTIAGNKSLKNLQGLSSLDSILGHLLIQQNDSIINLTGIGSLKYIGRIVTFFGNKSFSNFKGLTKLSRVNGLNVLDNPKLKNFEGLETLKLTDSFFVRRNNSLKSFMGLQNIDTIKVIIVLDENPALTSLMGLDHINFDSLKHLRIIGCKNLSICNAKNICNYLSNSTKSAWIAANLIGCNTRQEIINSCNDTNSVDIKEPFFQNLKAYPNPTSGIIVFANEELENFSAKLSDITGKVIKVVAIENRTIDISELESGIYFLTLETKDAFYRERIIKK
jgi:hypothetical protein